jgi:hypothetical protein
MMEVAQVTVPRGELVHRDPAGGPESQTGMGGSEEEVAIDGRPDLHGQLPWPYPFDDGSLVGETRGWEEMYEGGVAILE